MKSRGSVAVLSSSLPPDPSGQARVLSKVLGRIPSSELVLATEQRRDHTAWEMQAHYITLRPASEKALRLLPSLPGLRRLNAKMGLQRSIQIRGQELAQALKAYEPRVLVGCSGAVVDPPAGLLAAQRLGIPYIFYAFDDFCYQWNPGIHRVVAMRWHEKLMHGADQVIVPNQTLAQEYARRYSISPKVVLNPAEPAAYATTQLPWPSNLGSMRVVFTGSVYWANYDALRGVARALARLGGQAQLHIYTDQPSKVLEENGITGPVEHHAYIQPPGIFQVQQAADVLLLPLALDSPIPETLRTSCPAKLGEYLASGRPILAHVLPDSFVGQLFKERACGALVDRQSEDQLLDALRRIRDDEAWRKEMVASAMLVAQEFTQEAARDALATVLDQAERNKG